MFLRNNTQNGCITSKRKKTDDDCLSEQLKRFRITVTPGIFNLLI